MNDIVLERCTPYTVNAASCLANLLEGETRLLCVNAGVDGLTKTTFSTVQIVASVEDALNIVAVSDSRKIFLTEKRGQNIDGFVVLSLDDFGRCVDHYGVTECFIERGKLEEVVGRVSGTAKRVIPAGEMVSRNVVKVEKPLNRRIFFATGCVGMSKRIQNATGDSMEASATYMALEAAGKRRGYSTTAIDYNGVLSTEFRDGDIVMVSVLNSPWESHGTGRVTGLSMAVLDKLVKAASSLENAVVGIRTSLHVSEVMQGSIPSRDFLEKLSNTCRLFVCHENRMDEIREISGVNFTRLEIPYREDVYMKLREISSKKRDVGKRRILVQNVAQARKSMEVNVRILAEALRNTSYGGEIEVVLHGTADWSFSMKPSTSARWLESLDLPSNVRIVETGHLSEVEYQELIATADVAMSFQSDEGISYIPLEVWLSGGQIVMHDMSPCTSYKDLGDGVYMSRSIRVEQSGMGEWNDTYRSDVYIPEFDSGVEQTILAIEAEPVIGGREPNESVVIVDSEKYGEVLMRRLGLYD